MDFQESLLRNIASLKAEIETLWEEIKQNESAYYKDLIICLTLVKELKRDIDKGLISKNDSADLFQYLSQKQRMLAGHVADEREAMYKENPKGIERVLRILIQVLSESDTFQKSEFEDLFQNAHSRYYQETIAVSNMIYDVREGTSYRFKAIQWKRLLDLLNKIIFEKKLIHKDWLSSKIINNSSFKMLLDFLLEGKISEALGFVEQELLKRWSSLSLDGKIPNQWRKGIVLKHQYGELYYRNMEGTISIQEWYWKMEELLMDLFDFIEESVRDSGQFLYRETEKATEMGAREKSKQLPQEVEKEVKKLILTGRNEEVVDYLLEKLPKTNPYYKELVMNKNQIKVNQQNEREGRGFDEGLLQRIIRSIIDQFELY